jgi:hypothetical protein
LLQLRRHERLDSAFGGSIRAYTRLHNDHNDFDVNGRFAAVLANNYPSHAL